MKKIIAIITFIIPSYAVAADSVLPEWESIKTVKCFFDSGVRFEAGQVKIVKEPYGKESIIYDSINIEQKSAHLIGPANRFKDTAELSILNVKELAQITFESVNTIGNSVFSTLAYNPMKGYVAVISLHSANVVGGPIFEQNYGTCKVLN